MKTAHHTGSAALANINININTNININFDLKHFYVVLVCNEM
jgi:hypothetical protein